MTESENEPALLAGALESWTPIDLAVAGAEPPEPPTIASLIYPGRVHVLSGEPGSLKSFTALAVMADQVRAGRTVAYIDLENGPGETRSRLSALGLTDEEISAAVLYLRPTEPLTPGRQLAAFLALLEARNPSLVTIDGYTGSLALCGGDPNSSIDIERHHRTVVEPLRSTGAAILLIDALVKNRESRGRFSIGSERKIAVADVHLGFSVVLPLRRGGRGIVRLAVHKDRPGYLASPRAGDIHFESSDAGARLTWALEAVANPAEGEQASGFRPTVLMDRVLAFLAGQTDPVSQRLLVSSVSGKTDYLLSAIELLFREGQIREERGAHGARLYSLAGSRPLPDLSPASSEDLSPDLSPPRRLVQAEATTSPHLSPTSPLVVPSSSPPSPHPLQGGRGRGERSSSQIKSSRRARIRALRPSALTAGPRRRSSSRKSRRLRSRSPATPATRSGSTSNTPRSTSPRPSTTAWRA